MIPTTLTAAGPKAKASGMPDIPLVLFPLGADGLLQGCSPVVTSAFSNTVAKHAIIFHDEQGQIACFWDRPQALIGYLQASLRLSGADDPRPFGCIPPDVSPPAMIHPDMRPVGIAVRTGGQVERLIGFAGVVSFKSTCMRLFSHGMRSPNMTDRMRKLMMARMPVLEYRRAERDIASL